MTLSAEFLQAAFIFAIGIGGVAADAWRRARRADERADRMERKLDAVLVTLGVDPDATPAYNPEFGDEGRKTEDERR